MLSSAKTVLFLSLAATIASCGGRVHITTVRYVLPPKFHGRFDVYEKPGTKDQITDGVLTVRISKNGVGTVSSFKLLEEFISYEVYDEENSLIQKNIGLDSKNDKVHSFGTLGVALTGPGGTTTQSSEDALYVGSRKEFLALPESSRQYRPFPR